MQSINALSLVPDVNNWLANSRQPRILHIFERACNLINERREILSIVTPQIGNGPFNLVVEDKILFSKHLNIESSVSILDNHLTVGDLTINTETAQLWNPCPKWEGLHAKRNHITKLLLAKYRTRSFDTPLATNHFDMLSASAPGYSTTSSLQSLFSDLSSALAKADTPTAKTTASKLAGLGAGLTPSGDDFIMGALYSTWIIHPRGIASALAQEIAETTAGLTTSLSAAWINSAGRGEAGELWHRFFEALTTGAETDIQRSIEQILSVGETSGADALAGFFGVFASLAELATFDNVILSPSRNSG